MKILLIMLSSVLFQGPSVTITKFNGDQFDLNNARIFQEDEVASGKQLSYFYRDQVAAITISDIKRISFKETVKRKKGITTYRVILVKNSNDKLEVEMNLVRVEGIGVDGKEESINLSSVEKISF